MNPILEVHNLRKEYKDFALDDISFSLPGGRILGLIGPNGAGKTTAIKLIMNMIRKHGGRISIFGMEYGKNEKEIKNRIGYVGEESFFYGNRTVSWTGKYISSFFEKWDTNNYQKMLSDFALNRTKKIQDLSKGQKVKFSLALALAHQPQLAILDEPTAGLDPIVRRDVLDILRIFVSDEKKSVIISSHITDDIVRTADTVAFLIKGKIALLADKDELFHKWKIIHFQKDRAKEEILNHLQNVTEHRYSISGVTGDYPMLADTVKEDLALGNIKVENAGLDDILITLAKGDPR